MHKVETMEGFRVVNNIVYDCNPEVFANYKSIFNAFTACGLNMFV